MEVSGFELKNFQISLKTTILNIIVPIMQSKIDTSKDEVKSASNKAIVIQKNNSVKSSKEESSINSKNTFIMPVKGKIIGPVEYENSGNADEFVHVSRAQEQRAKCGWCLCWPLWLWPLHSPSHAPHKLFREYLLLQK